jgi:hypothetical protein
MTAPAKKIIKINQNTGAIPIFNIFLGGLLVLTVAEVLQDTSHLRNYLEVAASIWLGLAMLVLVPYIIKGDFNKIYTEQAEINKTVCQYSIPH